MSVNLDLPKYKCQECEYFSPMTTEIKQKNGTKFVVGCACKNLCDSLQKLEKEVEKQKDIIDKIKEESQYISKWEFVFDEKDSDLQPIFMPVTLPKKNFYHNGCPAITDLRIMKNIKFYDEEYKFCPDCGEPMIIPKYAEDIKPCRNM